MADIMVYNREKAVEYAHQWAYGRNPAYGDFSKLGGDCTNFASQALYAGAGVMNYTPETGWYYNHLNSRAPAWTGVPFFYNFLTANQGPGPFGEEVDLARVEIGDFIQFTPDGGRYTHTLVVVHASRPAALGSLRVAAHSFDADDRPLQSYAIKNMRCLHILGCRKG